ncbi:MAG: hypothetical protein OXS30_10010 [Chloroflexota bacterium]|nr:hypothetical protein [Chloroflexota bacterium]
MASDLTEQLREWRERTESIESILRAEADHNDELRHLSPATTRALRGIEAFGICTPVELGGWTCTRPRSWRWLRRSRPPIPLQVGT